MTIPIHTDDGMNTHKQYNIIYMNDFIPSLLLELQLASFEIEPPENSGEKKRYQELRYGIVAMRMCNRSLI